MTIDILAPDLAMVIQCIIISISGLICNGALLGVITLKKDLRRKDYICFIFNRTLADFILGLIFGTMQVIAILFSSPTSSLCMITGYLQIVLGSTSIYTEPFMACNRYISIFHDDLYEKVYKMRYICLMCLGAWVLSIILSIPHVFLGSVGRATGSICSIRFAPDTLAVTIGTNFSVVLLSLSIVIFFNYKMFRYLKSYQTKQITNSQKTKLQTDREILRFIFVATFMPMLFGTPSMVILWVQMTMPVSAWLSFSATAIYAISLPVNTAIALFMLKPIRKEFLKTIKKMLGLNSAVISIHGQVVTT